MTFAAGYPWTRPAGTPRQANFALADFKIFSTTVTIAAPAARGAARSPATGTTEQNRVPDRAANAVPHSTHLDSVGVGVRGAQPYPPA